MRITGLTWGLAGDWPYYWYWRRHGRRKWRDLTVSLPEVLKVLRDRRLASCDYMPEVSTSVPYSRLPKMDISSCPRPSFTMPFLSPPPSVSSTPVHYIVSLHIFRGNS